MVEIWVGIMVKVRSVITIPWIPRILLFLSKKPEAHTVEETKYCHTSVKFKAISA